MLIPPMQFQCCFHCSAYGSSHRVEKLIGQSFPSESAWLRARDRMLQPVLLRMAEASSGCMPVQWTDARLPLPRIDPLQEESADMKDKIRHTFWRLCRMARLSFEEYAAEETHDETFIQMFHRLADYIMTLLTCRKDGHEPIVRRRAPEAVRLFFQVDLLNNEDRVLDSIYNLASHQLGLLTSHLDTFALYGALEYSLAMSKELLSLAHRVDHSSRVKVHYIKSLRGYVDTIQSEVDQQHAMRLVLATSLKDKGSSLHILGADMLRHVVQYLQQPEILRWEDVMLEFITFSGENIA